MLDFYTYPILGVEGHFLNHSFKVELLSTNIDESNYNFKFKYYLEEPNIIELIDSKSSVVAIRVKNRAFYYEVYEFDSKELDISIPISDIGDNFVFDFKPFILVKESGLHYRNSNADSLRAQYTYNLAIGNLLAVSKGITVTYELGYKDFDRAGSFIKLRQNKKGDTLPVLNFQQHALYIDLCEKDFTELIKLNNSPAKDVLVGNLIFPILVDLVWRIKTKEIEIDEYEWAEELLSKVDLDNPFDSVQKWLRNPVLRSSEAIVKIFKDEE